ncbi:MRG/MORF4L-binding protein [Uranotaenia lowii]|uniref:MRG/MORF4L-binding protein n=1 Tax=Uranotaenia lowii TaxID=190385 RepID=UPI0024789DBF|nr:MRG/MORF4L-binding protein [Uranotaenia lowii]XP_055612853.1 MRG/MORF4L-binding protein [Uranotaenia lowii]
MATVKEKSEPEYFEWSPEDEIQLFFAMDGLRPVGINRHFFLACIVERLSKALNRNVSSEAVWSHLKTLYNLKALDELEQLPFPNDETDFVLPEEEFGTEIKFKTEEEPVIDESKKSESKPEPTTVKPAKDKEPTEKEKPSSTEKEVRESVKPTKAAKQEALVESTPKRPQKRTRGSMSLEPNSSNSPASTPPHVQVTKRRRI